jgi:signal transduction histidine kinase
MQTYEIKGDLSEEQHTYLGVIFGGTLLASLLLLAVNALSATFALVPWICMAGTLAVSYGFWRRQQTALASWIYTGGLLAAFTLLLWEQGPSVHVYFWMLLPVVLASLLFGPSEMGWVAALSVGLMLITTAARVGVGDAIRSASTPVFLCIILVSALYVKARSTLDIVYWATDIQKKDSSRAEMFYEKSEQLREALLQLTHANSKLELLNKRLEEAQHQAERASQAKSIFLSNMSHELRTPLNVVIGYTSTMLDMPGMYGNVPLPPAYRSDVQLIKDNGYYLLGLINDILDLSKIEAGKLELHRTSVDLPELFRGILSTSIGLVKDKPLQIRPDFPNDLPRVWADPTRVRQIILNLMSNAIKFTQTGSVTLHAHVADGNVQISVIDTGIGIPEKALNLIFDRFQQAEHDTDKQYGGTGLGLDISRQLARMHGGDLTVESTVGRGSTFSFAVPILVEPVEEQPEIPPATLAKPLATVPEGVAPIYTILLAEDEVSMRDVMRRALENAGHVVVDVQDGADVLDMATGLLPDLIILDVRLPNVDGWHILESLKQDPETASIPVVVSTVNEDEDHARELGADLYLRKPFSTEELLACVQDFLPYSLETGENS